MSEHFSSSWSTPWLDAQQKYWDTWLNLNRANNTEKTPPPTNPWAQGFEQWSQRIAETFPPESRDWVQKLTEMNRTYLNFGETLWKSLGSAQAGGNPQADWWNLLNQNFKALQSQWSEVFPFGHPKESRDGFATFWGMPLDTWRRVYSACSMMPGDFEKAMRDFGAGNSSSSPFGWLSQLMSTPSLGYTREWQEEMQTLWRLGLEHMDAWREYNSLLAEVNTRAAELLQTKLQKLVRDGKTPDSLRTFYDEWVDAGEEAYAAIALSPAFAKIQAHLTNTLMAVKRQEQKMVDEILSALNMPTRREIDASHRRVHQLQRQVWQLQEALDQSDILALRNEVMALHREVELLRKNVDSAPDERPTNSRKSKSTGHAS